MKVTDQQLRMARLMKTQQIETMAHLLKAGHKQVYFCGKRCKINGRIFHAAHYRLAQRLCFLWREENRKRKKENLEILS